MQGEVGRAVRLSSTLGTQEMYVAVPIEQGGRVVAIVRAAMPLASVNDAVPELSWKIGAVSTIVASLAAVVGYLVSSASADR